VDVIPEFGLDPREGREMSRFLDGYHMGVFGGEKVGSQDGSDKGAEEECQEEFEGGEHELLRRRA